MKNKEILIDVSNNFLTQGMAVVKFDLLTNFTKSKL